MQQAYDASNGDFESKSQKERAPQKQAATRCYPAREYENLSKKPEQKHDNQPNPLLGIQTIKRVIEHSPPGDEYLQDASGPARASYHNGLIDKIVLIGKIANVYSKTDITPQQKLKNIKALFKESWNLLNASESSRIAYMGYSNLHGKTTLTVDEQSLCILVAIAEILVWFEREESCSFYNILMPTLSHHTDPTTGSLLSGDTFYIITKDGHYLFNLEEVLAAARVANSLTLRLPVYNSEINDWDMQQLILTPFEEKQSRRLQDECSDIRKHDLIAARKPLFLSADTVHRLRRLVEVVATKDGVDPDIDVKMRERARFCAYLAFNDYMVNELPEPEVNALKTLKYDQHTSSVYNLIFRVLREDECMSLTANQLAKFVASCFPLGAMVFYNHSRLREEMTGTGENRKEVKGTLYSNHFYGFLDNIRRKWAQYHLFFIDCLAGSRQQSILNDYARFFRLNVDNLDSEIEYGASALLAYHYKWYHALGLVPFPNPDNINWNIFHALLSGFYLAPPVWCVTNIFRITLLAPLYLVSILGEFFYDKQRREFKILLYYFCSCYKEDKSVQEGTITASQEFKRANYLEKIVTHGFYFLLVFLLFPILTPIILPTSKLAEITEFIVFPIASPTRALTLSQRCNIPWLPFICGLYSVSAYLLLAFYIEPLLALVVSSTLLETGAAYVNSIPYLSDAGLWLADNAKQKLSSSTSALEILQAADAVIVLVTASSLCYWLHTRIAASTTCRSICTMLASKATNLAPKKQQYTMFSQSQRESLLSRKEEERDYHDLELSISRL